MKRLIAATVFVLASTSMLNSAEFTWTDIQSAYWPTFDFVWVAGNVTSDGGETAGEALGMNCPFHNTGGITTVESNHDFIVTSDDPDPASGPIPWTLLIYDSNNNQGTQGGVANEP